MKVHKNKKYSAIPQSQIVISDEPPPMTFITPVDKYLKVQSTDTMIVKNMDSMKQSKSLESQLAHIHRTEDVGLLSEESEESSDDDEDDEQSPKDPIDASEEEEAAGYHRKNLSTFSDKSHHDRRTMVINDDLDLQNVINEAENESE